MPRFANLTTEDIAMIDRSSAVIIQPIGAVEQHGPHLPLITDALMAERVSLLAMDLLPGASMWLLPTLHYGKSIEHLGRDGTISLSTSTLMSVCLDLGRSIADSRFQKLVFVNGHGGQPALLDVVARDIRRKTGLQVFTVMPHRFGLPQDLPSPVDEPYGIHGGQLETSVMLSLAPELVHIDRAVDEGGHLAQLFPTGGRLQLEGLVTTAWLTDDVSRSGVLGNASAATKELGDAFVAHQARCLADLLLEIARFGFADHSTAQREQP